MRWDLAKCEKTGCCLPRIWIPNAQAKLQKNIARVRRQRKMTFDWRPWFVHLWFHFVACFFYAVCTGSTNRLRNIATSELALPDKHKTKGKHWDLQSVQSSSTMTLRGWTTPTMFQSKYHSRQSTKLRVGYPKKNFRSMAQTVFLLPKKNTTPTIPSAPTLRSSSLPAPKAWREALYHPSNMVINQESPSNVDVIRELCWTLMSSTMSSNML